VNFRIRDLLTKTIGYALAGYTKDLCTRPRDISKKDWGKFSLYYFSFNANL